MLHRSRMGAKALSLTFAVVLGSCSLFDGLTGLDGLSQTEADALADHLMQGTRNGVQSSAVALRSSDLSSSLTQVDATPQAATCNTNGCVFNDPISSQTNCTDGGSINVTGSLTGSLNNSGSGILQFGLTETITDWRCVGGKVINGDPYISLVGTFTFLNGQQSTQASMTMTGGVKWGTAAKDSCQLYLTFLFYPDGSARVTGTICSRSVVVTT